MVAFDCSDTLAAHISSYLDSLGLFGALSACAAEPEQPQLTRKDAVRCQEHLGALLPSLPDPQLSAADRAYLSGQISRGGMTMILAAAHALAAEETLFPGAARAAAALDARARRAFGYQALADQLGRMAQTARDLALLDLGTASRDTSAVLRAAVTEAAQTRSTATQGARCDALAWWAIQETSREPRSHGALPMAPSNRGTTAEPTPLGTIRSAPPRANFASPPPPDTPRASPAHPPAPSETPAEPMGPPTSALAYDSVVSAGQPAPRSLGSPAVPGGADPSAPPADASEEPHEPVQPGHRRAPQRDGRLRPR